MSPRLAVGFLNQIFGRVTISAQAIGKPVEFLPMLFHQCLVANLTGLYGRIGLHHHILTPWSHFSVTNIMRDRFPRKV